MAAFHTPQVPRVLSRHSSVIVRSDRRQAKRPEAAGSVLVQSVVEAVWTELDNVFLALIRPESFTALCTTDRTTFLTIAAQHADTDTFIVVEQDESDSPAL